MDVCYQVKHRLHAPTLQGSLTIHIDCPMCGRMDGHVIIKISRMGRLTKFLSGCLHEKTRTGASFIPGWLGQFISRYLKGTFHVDKIHVRFKITNITHARPVPVYRPISHRNVRSFGVYMIPLLDFVPEWHSRPGTTTGVNSRRGGSCRHDILCWYHLNKCRAMRGNRSELTPARNAPVSCKQPLRCEALNFFKIFETYLLFYTSCWWWRWCVDYIRPWLL